MYVVNLLGEPGVGKSVTAAGIFYKLATNGFAVELVQEVAKGYAWESQKDKRGELVPHPIFDQQIFILGSQNRWLERVSGKREIAITEGSLLNSAIYVKDDYFNNFIPLVLEQFNKYNNINILLQRNHQFNNDGRVHNEEEAEKIKSKIISFLHKNDIKYKKFTTSKTVADEIVDYLVDNFFAPK